MRSKLPILIIIPHGGYSVPEELMECTELDEFACFIEADTCANELFNLKDRVTALIDTHINRLFVDLDRSYQEIPPKSEDGVIKSTTLQGKSIFSKSCFPDEIALSGILKRYYFPFHETVKKILKTGQIRLILECHTVMAVGPAKAWDAGRPRPIASVENKTEINGSLLETCPPALAEALLSSIEGSFSGEDECVGKRFSLQSRPSTGHIMKKYGRGDVPLMKLNISRSLFLNEKYFSYDFLRVDEIRIQQLKAKIAEALYNFSSSHL